MKLFVCCAVMAATFGCASVGRPIDEGKLARVVRGKSTRADVEALLGQPQTFSEVDGPAGLKTEMHYLYSYTAADGKNFIPYYGSFAQEYHSKSQDVTITLNRAGVVESIAKNFGGMSTKAGAASETPLAPKPAPATARPGPQASATNKPPVRAAAAAPAKPPAQAKPPAPQAKMIAAKPANPPVRLYGIWLPLM